MVRIVLFSILCLHAVAVFAEIEDPIVTLLRQETDRFSAAGQQGDDKTVDQLTDDYVLFSAGDGSVQRDLHFDAKDTLADELRAATEALHGPDRVRARFKAAPSALFVDDTGALNHESDFRHGPATVSDWVLHHDGNVAVASFSLHFNESRFLAVETWEHRDAQWQLIGGQTIPLYTDPPVIDLPETELDSYAAIYSAGTGSRVAITRDGQGLSMTVHGAKQPIELKPSAHDRFFTPNQPSGYLRASTDFQRNAAGSVTGFTRNGIHYARIDPSVAAAPTPPPTPGELRLRDFVVIHSDDVAIAAFYHDRDTPYYGQTLHQTFRSTETWVKRGDTWKLISSQGRQIPN
jgi:hypothetical protein